MPKDLQKEYLRKLRTVYGFGTRLAADMLGTTTGVFVERAKALGLNWPKSLLVRRTPEIVRAREAFLLGYEYPQNAGAREQRDASAARKSVPYDDAAAEERIATAVEPPRIDGCEPSLRADEAGNAPHPALRRHLSPRWKAGVKPAEIGYFRMEFAGDIPGVIERLRAVGAAFGDVIVRITVEAGT